MRNLFTLKLEAKFFLFSAVVILIGSTIADFLILRATSERILNEARRRAKLLAEATAVSFTNTLLYQEVGLVEEGGLMENQIADLLGNEEAEVRDVVVFNNEGQTIAANNYTWYHIKKDNPQLRRAMAAREFMMVQDLAGKPQEFDAIVPLHIAGKRFGVLIMHFSLKREYGDIALFRNHLLLLTLVGMAGFLILAVLIGKALARPIKRLVAEMGAISEENLTSTLVSKRRDEIGQLEKSFLKMLQRLRLAAEERKKSQQALIQTEKLAALGTLVAGVSHEINNPLAGLYNCLRRIEAHPEDTEQIRKYTKLMRKALSHIENTVRNLLNFSRQNQMTRKPVNLNHVIREALELLTYRLQKRGIVQNLNLADRLPMILGNPATLEQVFVNLMMNASDVMPEGGTLTISTRVEDNEVIAEVSDTGPGIPESELGKIFDPFYTTKDVGQGTGLGLSLSKRFVSDHQGTLEVNSQLNQGSTFRVRLPAMRGQANLKTRRVCTAILAGGKSSRMGKNKALLDLGGQRMIERVVSLAHKVSDRVMLITNTPEEYGFLRMQMFRDEIQGAGPLGGIYTALKHCDREYCLILACDMPFLSEALIRFLVENAGNAEIFALDVGRGPEPLCAVYSKTCLPYIESQIATGNYKVASLIKSARARVIRFGPGHSLYSKHLFYNINTPQDLERARHLAEKTSNERKTE